MGDKIKFQEIITISIFFLSIQSSFEYFYTIFKWNRYIVQIFIRIRDLYIRVARIGN